VLFSSVLAVRAIEVVGTDGSAADQVRGASSIALGVPLARVDAERAARGIRALPWVADVEVRRGWPDRVVLAVTLRSPVAALAGGQDLVDATGAVFPAVGPAPADLPVVRAEGDALVAATAVLTSLPPDLAPRVVRVAATTRDDVTLTLRSGAVVRWGSAEEAAAKAEVLRVLLERRRALYDVSSPQTPTTFRPRS
jgi:cell division protein FtsQ